MDFIVINYYLLKINRLILFIENIYYYFLFVIYIYSV